VRQVKHAVPWLPVHRVCDPYSFKIWLAVARSGGARQEVVRLHKDAPDFIINPPGYHDFQKALRNSMFCLAPSGWDFLCHKAGKQITEGSSPSAWLAKPVAQPPNGPLVLLG